MSSQVTWRSNQVATGQRSIVNDMPEYWCFSTISTWPSVQSVVKINISDSKINLSQTWGQALRYSFVFCLFSDAVSDAFDIYRHKTRMHSSRMRTARSRSRLLGGGGVLPQCMLGYTPWVWAWRPPWVWAWRSPGVGLETPQPDPSTSHLGVGLVTPPWKPDPSTSPWVWAWRPPPSQTPQNSPWVWTWRPARHAGIPPSPCGQNDRHM